MKDIWKKRMDGEDKKIPHGARMSMMKK